MCPSTEEDKKYISQFPYRELIGSFNYVSSILRSDITYATNYFARFKDNPGQIHWNNLLCFLAYLRDQSTAVITYGYASKRHTELSQIYAYVDADFASSDWPCRRSITGYCIFLIVGWSAGRHRYKRLRRPAPRKQHYTQRVQSVFGFATS